MINDFLSWRKAYRGPFKRDFAYKLLNDIRVNPDVSGIYGKRIKKARNVDMFDIYIKTEKKLSPLFYSTK